MATGFLRFIKRQVKKTHKCENNRYPTKETREKMNIRYINNNIFYIQNREKFVQYA